MTNIRTLNNWYLFPLALWLSACGGGGGSGDGGSPVPGPGPAPTSHTISIGDDRIVDEGSDGGTTDVEFTISLDTTATADVSFEYSVVHVTTEPSDFVSAGGTATIAAGSSTATATVSTVADTAFELDEEFSVVLSNPSSNATIGNNNATGVLVNDDDLTIIFDVFYLGNFDATLGGRNLDLDYDLLFDISDLLNDLGATELFVPFDIYYQSDVHLPFFVASGNLRISIGGGTTGSIRVIVPQGLDGIAIGGNFVVEFDWSAVFGLPTATWQIETMIEPQDVESSAPILTVGDASLFDEGDSGTTSTMTFVGALSQPLAADLEVAYNTLDGSATAPDDYDAVGGVVTIPAGDTEFTITVTANGDDDAEGSAPEAFIVALEADGDIVLLGYPWATGLIYDDDTAADNRRVAIQNAQIVEGDSGTSNMEFDVTLDDAAVTPITFRFATRDDTAEGGVDYEITTGEQTFAPGDSLLVISVPVFGDTEPEDDERFLVDITEIVGNGIIAGSGVGTIQTDDPVARVSVSNIALAEGDSGTTPFEFTVSLSDVLDTALDIDYSTGEVTAAAGDDYLSVSSNLTIAAGANEGSIEILVNGDTDAEDDEVFEVVIDVTSPNAAIENGTGLGTILNDDGDGGWAGAELVHMGSTLGAPQIAVRPQVGFGPGGERHIVFLQQFAMWHTISSARGTWTPPIEVGPVSTLIRSPRLVVDRSGSAVSALIDTFLVSYTYEPSTNWRSEPLPTAVESDSEFVLTGDPATGDAIAVWREPANSSNNNAQSAWSARFEPGLGWQDMGLVEAIDSPVGTLDATRSANGDTIAVLAQPPVATSLTADVVAYHLAGATWMGPRVLDNIDTTTAVSPKIDSNVSGDAAVAWQQNTPVTTGIARPSIYLNLYNAALDQWFDDPVLVEAEVDFSARDPDVAIDADGNVFVIWLQDSPDYRTQDLHANRYDAATQTWSGPILLELDDTSTSFGAIDSQQIAADDLGNAIVVWTQDDGVQRNIRTARYSAADGDWLPGELLEDTDTGDANIPLLVVDRSSGDAMVVWHQNNGSTSIVDIWANRYQN